MMVPPTQITYRLMQPGDEIAVSEMVTRVFDRFVTPDYSPEGVQEFKRYIKPAALLKHIQENCFAILATAPDGQLAGMIEMRNHDHVSLLFVDEQWQHQGIARALWDQARAMCLAEKPDLAAIDVNSSPFAIPIYERLGFQISGPEQTINGIRFTPLIYPLAQAAPGE